MVPGLLLSGCIHSYYLPGSNHVPLLTGKKDARIVVNYMNSTGDLISGVPVFEVQGSYSPLNHFGISGTFLNAARVVDTTEFRTRYADLALGGYMTDPSKKIVLECYGGMGWGFADNRFGVTSSGGADYTKLFIQPAIGFTSRYFDVSVAFRIASVRHALIWSRGIIPEFEQSDFDAISANPDHMVWEPSVTFRFGDGPFKVQFQTGVSDSDKHRSRFHTSVGLFVSLPWTKYKPAK